jgi:hypothetical protein
MATKFQIKGVVTVMFDDKQCKITLKPDPIWMSPDKKFAVGYAESGESKSFKLDEDGAIKIQWGSPPYASKWFEHLFAIAIAQKPVKLLLGANRALHGFIFPAQ